jgi:hypothetical protein
MRKKFVLSFLLAALMTEAAWSQFYKDYSEQERKYLAESYYLAGAQYVKLGKAELGKQYEDLAYGIYPQLAPSKIAEEKQPTAEELLAQGMAKAIVVPEAPGKPELAPRSFFLRLLGAFLDENPSEITEFLDGSVYIDALAGDVTRTDAEEALKELFTSLSLSGFAPSDIYDLDSLGIEAAPSDVRQTWGQSSVLRVNAKMDFSEEVGFWEQSQQFYLRKSGAGWYIFAIGRNAPPRDWKPQPISAPVAPPETTMTGQPAPYAEIEDAFSRCVSAFLAKDLDGTLAFMADDIQFLRMRQSITRDELKDTFQGYFEGTDFSSIQLSDIIDTESMFVEPTTEFASEVQGPEFILNVTAKLDLSDMIPFWTTYQRYYFTKQGSDWKIFALF